RNTSSSPALTALAASNPNIHILPGDITSLPQLRAAADSISKITGGSLDVLVNNAGYVEDVTGGLLPSSLTDDENLPRVVDSFNKSIETNVLGAIYVTNALLRLILKGEQKKIVHTSSGMADTDLVLKSGLGYAVPYSASKAALNLVVAKFAAELGPQGVKVVAMSPGWVDTDDEVSPEKEAAVQYMASQFAKVDPRVKGRIEKEVSIRDQLETISKLSMELSGSFISQHGNKDWF
ncbi:putative oxidoreductase, partial [Lachnellula suecica]